ncbi:MAG: PaaI family thioesterase [Myxococcaceae bacterium]
MSEKPSGPPDSGFTIDVEVLNGIFRDLVPHNRALGMSLVQAGVSPAVAVLRLPYDERFVGNPETGVLHGGVITALVDAACGASVHFKLQSAIPIATLDLRIDYLKPATPGKAVHARAECFKATHNVAFVRAIAYHDLETDPLAAASATFMISTKGRSVTDLEPHQVIKGEPS